MTTNLTTFAAEQQLQFNSSTLPRERIERAHFGTPILVADFMAEMFSQIPEGLVRILDAGAGVGTLSAALCQRILNEKRPRHLQFELWENDPKVVPWLCETMDRCKTTLNGAGHILTYTIHCDDFILANSQKPLFGPSAESAFHLAIMNPPYYKLRKDSDHAKAMNHVVHGQPNVYALFMAVAADLLLSNGEMIAITPRSYFNGPYFARFRRWFFDRMAATQVHVFDSRTEAFKDDQVLQENVILRARKQAASGNVVVTVTKGRDFQNVVRREMPYGQVLESASGDHLVRLATNRLEQQIMEVVDSLPLRLDELGFRVSTGPVVTFRSTAYLRKEQGHDTAPLVWMHNILPFATRLPASKNGKPMHILVSDESKRLLLPAKRYVLLKRFTSKEERRRLVAGIMESDHCYSSFVGLENHLNYVYRPGKELTKNEAFGLAGYLNSELVDRYFRAVSGNTQVNAAEIRSMPFPDNDVLGRIGKETQKAADQRQSTVERIVARALRLSEKLVDQLCESEP